MSAQAATYRFNKADLAAADRLMWDFIKGAELSEEEHKFAALGKRAREIMGRNGGKYPTMAEVQRDLEQDDWVLVVQGRAEDAVTEAQRMRLELTPIAEVKTGHVLCLVEQGIYPHVVSGTVYAWSHSGGSCLSAERVRDAVKRLPEIAPVIQSARGNHGRPRQ